MSGAEVSLAISVFLASAVEAVEAFTIVLAVGSTRSWPSAYRGVAAASLVLACVIAILGPALTVLPIDVLRLLVGSLLLIFGLQWLRKTILRAGGAKAMHDEAAIYERAPTVEILCADAEQLLEVGFPLRVLIRVFVSSDRFGPSCRAEESN